MHSVTNRAKYQSAIEKEEENIAWHEMERSRRKSGVVQPGGNGHKVPIRKRSVIHRTDTFDQSLLSFREADSAKRTLKGRLQWISSAVATMGFLSVVLAIVDIELASRLDGASHSMKDPVRITELVVTSCLSLVSIFTCFVMFQLYSAELRLLVLKNVYHKSEGLWTTSLFPTFLVESVICIIHVPPMAIELGVPYKLQLLVFLRIYLVTRYVKEHSRFINNKGTAFFASVTKTEISTTFLVKAYFLKYPFVLIGIIYSLNVFLGGYFVYVIEDSLSYMDTIWMLVVTMTTLGFGDVVPMSLLGRAFVGFASVLGIFLMALFISVVHETLQLGQQEKRILATTENAEHSSEKRNLAAACIQSAWRLHNYTIKNLKTLEIGDSIKATKWRYLQHRMWSQQRQWRLARKSSSSDEYWRKLFLADDTAMMLTDVYRAVNNIEQQIPKQPYATRKMSRNSIRKISVSSPIREETDEPQESFQENDRRVHIGLMECRKSGLDQSTNNSEHTPHCTSNHVNHRIHCLRKRTESDPISVDLLEGKIESFEQSLDDIFHKVKSELQDMKDSLNLLRNRSSLSTLGGSPTSPIQDMNSTWHSLDKVDV